MRLMHAAPLLLILNTSLFPAEIGEFSIPPVMPLDSHQIGRLRTIVKSDSSAAALARTAQEEARPLLSAVPHPLEVIHYEGLVNTDPRRIASVENLKDMATVARLMRYWQVSGDTAAVSVLIRFVSAWARVYKPDGNDVNENKLYPLLVARFSLGAEMRQGARDTVDAWLHQMGILHERAVRTSTHFTNRYTKHLRLLTLIGRISGNEAWVQAAHDGITRFVTQSLRADGSSLDLERRDALSYHQSSLRPVIELAALAGEKGRDLYTWTSPDGGSIKKSVDYVVPYAMGHKTHREWVNTKVDLDKRRAAAGLEHYKPGKLFEPKSALPLMAAASYFDSSLIAVVGNLAGKPTSRFPSWEMLVNEATRVQPVQK